MGCNTCKKNIDKEQQSNNNEESVLQSIKGQSFFIRLVAFFSLTLTIPLILLVLLGQIFIFFFFSGYYNKITSKFRMLINKLFIKYVTYKKRKEIKSKEKQFKNNRDYKEGSELLEIEVYEDNNEKNKDEK